MDREKQESPAVSMIRDSGVTTKTIEVFRRTIYDHYASYGRKLPWRDEAEPYHVFISEVMLQQTQVDRVIDKYLDFIREFPDFHTLAAASLERVLLLWKGLGYNRRALALQKSAHIISNRYQGVLPAEYGELISLPGIGSATASSILAFAFNKPVVFIETNIRTVFIHFFFSDETTVHDRDMLPLVEKTLDRVNPGKWYNALMDYGLLLKKNNKNPGRKSRHYRKQPPFEGSKRQMRGKILEAVLNRPGIEISQIYTNPLMKEYGLSAIIDELHHEGFIKKIKNKLYINNLSHHGKRTD